MNDLISRQAAIDAIGEKPLAWIESEYEHGLQNQWERDMDAIKILPSVQQDAITVSLEELINDYGEDGYFIVDGVNYQANELLNELKINSSVGEKFRKKIAKTIVQYFMKFGG